MALSNRSSSLDRPDLIITEYRSLIHRIGKGQPKIPVKVSSRSNDVIESYGPFKSFIKPGSTRPHHHQVSIPLPLHGKVHPETPVKV